MDAGLVLAVGLVYLFAFTNGVHDAANAIATLVATRSGRPGPALLTATAAMLAGPLLVGAAVADTIAGLVRLGQAETVETVTAALVGALVWNLLAWYRGLPSSATHALVGGLAGAAAASSGPHAIEWGSLQGWRPAGVLGVAVALVASPLLGALACLALLRALRRGLRRATRRFRGPVRHAQ
ncbi:MAG TPA: inorganic phosphate transporter, partial [Gaiellaceae bacterium]|nr:inorganic phosphate transporter [Gaiellaceae bacterium]